jgi:hypothetical protein
VNPGRPSPLSEAAAGHPGRRSDAIFSRPHARDQQHVEELGRNPVALSLLYSPAILSALSCRTPVHVRTGVPVGGCGWWASLIQLPALAREGIEGHTVASMGALRWNGSRARKLSA